MQKLHASHPMQLQNFKARRYGIGKKGCCSHLVLDRTSVYDNKICNESSVDGSMVQSPTGKLRSESHLEAKLLGMRVG